MLVMFSFKISPFSKLLVINSLLNFLILDMSNLFFSFKLIFFQATVLYCRCLIGKTLYLMSLLTHLTMTGCFLSFSDWHNKLCLNLIYWHSNPAYFLILKTQCLTYLGRLICVPPKAHLFIWIKPILCIIYCSLYYYKLFLSRAPLRKCDKIILPNYINLVILQTYI